VNVDLKPFSASHRGFSVLTPAEALREAADALVRQIAGGADQWTAYRYAMHFVGKAPDYDPELFTLVARCLADVAAVEAKRCKCPPPLSAPQARRRARAAAAGGRVP
jgi:hypothetical protein